MINVKNGFPKKFIDLRSFKRSWQLYVIIALPLAHILLFQYAPMYGVIVSFKDFKPSQGILASPWVGFDNFERFIKSYYFKRTLTNTLTISIYSLSMFPIPVMLAILINECHFPKYKKFIQTITYAPHFISMVVMVSMTLMFLSLTNGTINNIIALFGGTRTNFIAYPRLFKSIYVFSGIWQSAGYSSIIYLAALTGIDPTLYEAATIDGATRIKKVIHIDLPSITPMIIILLIINFGHLMSVGFEKVYLLQNDLNLSSSETISTYVYKLGLERADFSLASSIGLFNSVINLVLIIIVNKIAREFSEISLW